MITQMLAACALAIFGGAAHAMGKEADRKATKKNYPYYVRKNCGITKTNNGYYSCYHCTHHSKFITHQGKYDGFCNHHDVYVDNNCYCTWFYDDDDDD